jgi:hypothetical protein
MRVRIPSRLGKRGVVMALRFLFLAMPGVLRSHIGNVAAQSRTDGRELSRL